jgi:hypothetical protein
LMVIARISPKCSADHEISSWQTERAERSPPQKSPLPGLKHGPFLSWINLFPNPVIIEITA